MQAQEIAETGMAKVINQLNTSHRYLWLNCHATISLRQHLILPAPAKTRRNRSWQLGNTWHSSKPPRSHLFAAGRQHLWFNNDQTGDRYC